MASKDFCCPFKVRLQVSFDWFLLVSCNQFNQPDTASSFNLSSVDSASLKASSKITKRLIWNTAEALEVNEKLSLELPLSVSKRISNAWNAELSDLVSCISFWTALFISYNYSS